MNSSEKSKSVYEARISLDRLRTKQTSKAEEHIVELKVVSNYAKNRVVLLDGKYALSFNEDGVALCPAHLRESLDREMRNKPNRYRIESAVVPVVVVEAAKLPESEIAAVLDVPMVEVPEVKAEPEEVKMEPEAVPEEEAPVVSKKKKK